MNDKIDLVYDTFDNDDLDELCTWIKKREQLSQGPLVEKFEQEFSKHQNCKYSIFVNSGSSANLLIAYSLYVSDLLKNKKIVLPTLSWVTTVSPWIQLGFNPILCDVDKETLGVDLEHLERIFKDQQPALVMIVDVLGFPNKYNEIKKLCEEYDVMLLIDDCECQGSTYDGVKTGNFGLMSSYSFFISHLMQTIEGGMITTNDEQLATVLKMIRNHGWVRQCDKEFQKKCQAEYNIDDFNNMFSFYLPGFNVRSTDLQAFLGIRQLKKVDDFIDKRNKNFLLYQSLIKNDYWKIKPTENSFVGCFAYPIIHPKRKELVKKLEENKISTRPLISGSMSKQPYWTDLYGKISMPFGDIVHEFGLYLPCHIGLSEEQIKFICEIVNSVTN